MRQLDDSLINKFYSRQIKIPEIGREGQLKLLNSALWVSTDDSISEFLVFLCASIGFGKIFLKDPDKYDELKLRTPFLSIKSFDNIDGFDRLYILGKLDIGLSNRANTFYVNFRKREDFITVVFSKHFEFWDFDVEDIILQKMIACILTAEITKHIVNDEAEKVVNIEFKEV